MGQVLFYFSNPYSNLRVIQLQDTGHLYCDKKPFKTEEIFPQNNPVGQINLLRRIHITDRFHSPYCLYMEDRD